MTFKGKNNMGEKTILLVEDNDFDVLLTRRALNKAPVSHRLVVARDGAEAVDYLFDRKNAGKDDVNIPDVVLLDLKLPRVSGLEVLKRIRADENTRQLPVLIVTGSDEEQDVEAAEQLGVTSYNVKPVDSTRYAEMILNLVAKYLK